MRAITVLMNGSVAENRFASIVEAFWLDVRAMWNAAVPTTDLAAAWLKQFKLTTLRQFAAEMDPQLSGIARIVGASKKADAVEIVAKALVHDGHGQPATVVVNARSMLPPGLEVKKAAVATTLQVDAGDDEEDPRDRAGSDVDPHDDREE